MFGRKKKTTRRSKKNGSIVPVLFTIGIIGWGFFAIDRLTAPLQEGDEIITHNANYSAKTRETREERDSWKVSLEKWIKKFESNKVNQKPVGEPSDHTLSNIDVKNLDVNNFNSNSNEKPLSVIPDKQLNTIMNNALRQKEEAEQSNELSKQEDSKPRSIADNSNKTEIKSNYYNKYKLYFYANDENGNLYLKVISVNSRAKPINVFRDLIAGPDEHQEKDRGLIESFPMKPKVLNASVENDTVVLNLNHDFGMGVSFETLKLQINQLWLTARQFPGTKSLKILINGKENQTIGSDGYNIPRVINESSWLIADHN